MKKLSFLSLLLLAWTAFAQTNTQEVLVLASAATEIQRVRASKGFELLNLGPNPIWCSIGDATKAVVNKARKIAAGDSWSADIPGTIKVFCIASTADQVTGAGTVRSEAL